MQSPVPGSVLNADGQIGAEPNTSERNLPEPIPVVAVVSQRQALSYSTNSSLSALNAADIENEGLHHPNELFDRVPGAWVSSGSGQEHLTALRSPVVTGAGACGAYMVLEDQVPTRPAGFCNVNQLFEVNLLQARRVDVLRGPGTVTYGSNALHGAISVYTPGPADQRFQEIGLELGSYSYVRARAALSGSNVAMQVNYTDAGSFRDDEQFRHALANLQFEHEAGEWTGRTSMAYAMLDQDTAGFILGENSYKDEELRTQNLNPEAYRKAWAFRLSSRWEYVMNNSQAIELIPYIRSSSMGFLQHFLPGQPLEENAQDSAGILFSWSISDELSMGADLEWTKGSLLEYQQYPLETGSDFLQQTRPQGYHYDYEVQALSTAVWLQWQQDLSTQWQFTAGLRAEYLRYDYDNLMLDGNSRDDGTACGFGGCLYTRPSDRSDSYTNLAPELGLMFRVNDSNSLYLRAARGFRAPQATELYRLQKGQSVADLQPETLDSIELGWNQNSESISSQLALFSMYKRNYIFRDADGYNVSNGRTSHLGVEASINWQIADSLQISGNVSWAEHEYDFNRNLGGSELITSGNEIDTAPPWLGGLQISWQTNEYLNLEAEWIYQGAYYIDAANEHSYEGHQLVNLSAWVGFAETGHSLAIRLNNIFDSRYAARADYAFGNYRYFPGAGRTLSVEWRFRR
jgi:outer membrane receptor protein involved in Fe transport